MPKSRSSPQRSTSKKVSYTELAGVKKTKEKTSEEPAAATAKEDLALLSNQESEVQPIVTDPPKHGDCPSCKVLADLVRALRKEQDVFRKEIEELRSEVRNKPSETAGEASIDVLAKKVKEIDEKVEERTNRQLRQTLVVRRLKESDDEKQWEDTTNLVAKEFADLLEVDFDTAKQSINRCHRGGSKKFYDRKGRVRPIFIAMMRWDACEALIKAAKEKKPAFSIDYKYGPMTTLRRNQALKLRKSLKAEGKIDKGFIKFPAMLMGKKTTDSNYELIHDFSKEDVSTFKDDE